eukprot:4486124-Amphidinium_carterae.1
MRAREDVLLLHITWVGQDVAAKVGALQRTVEEEMLALRSCAEDHPLDARAIPTRFGECVFRWGWQFT